MAIKRGTNVEFVGTRIATTTDAVAHAEADRWFQKQVKYYDAKYGVQLGDNGTVVRAKNGWFRVSFTRLDGTRVVSVPMRADHFTEKPAEEPEADGESSPVRPTSLLYGFEPTNEERAAELRTEVASIRQEIKDDAAICIQSVAKDYLINKRAEPCTQCGSLQDCERDIGDKLMYCRACFVAWDVPTPQHLACAQLLKSSRARCSCLEGELADYSVSMTELIAELDRVNLRLTASRTLMQLKDRTIAELQGAPSFERWGDWVVPEVGSG
jgi:hypothetical protein